ncbi:MAG: hypothetical protein JRE40_08070 [Deltaproteobacteria bacterium]|nr:hypothetical protein [Deltaproteobacteria bacterium]
MIEIKSNHEGFRRCGVAHGRKAVRYPDGRFTADELARLKADPMLTVVEIADPEPKEPETGQPLPPGVDEEAVIARIDKPIEELTVAELKYLLDRLKVDYQKSAVKADLVQLVYDNTEEPMELEG